MARPALPGRRRLTAGELDIILSAHARFVAGQPGGKRCSLPFVDFSGLDLAGRELSGAELGGAVFDGAKLAGRVTLTGAPPPARRARDPRCGA